MSFDSFEEFLTERRNVNTAEVFHGILPKGKLSGNDFKLPIKITGQNFSTVDVSIMNGTDTSWGSIRFKDNSDKVFSQAEVEADKLKEALRKAASGTIFVKSNPGTIEFKFHSQEAEKIASFIKKEITNAKMKELFGSAKTEKISTDINKETDSGVAAATIAKHLNVDSSKIEQTYNGIRVPTKKAGIFYTYMRDNGVERTDIRENGDVFYKNSAGLRLMYNQAFEAVFIWNKK